MIFSDKRMMVFAPETQMGATPSVVPAATAGVEGASVQPAITPTETTMPPAAVRYWPEGLDTALRGADEKATLDNLAKTVKGYRDRDAQRQVPTSADGYLDFTKLGDYKIEPQNQPYIEALKSDISFKPMAESALKHGISQKAMLDIYQSGLAAMAENGLLEPMIDPVAERKALLPEAARNLPQTEQDQAIEKRLRENFDFLALMQANRGLSKEVSEYAEMMLGDNAKGHQFFEFMRAQIQGAGSGPGAYGGANNIDTKESLRRERAAISVNDPQRAAKEASLDERYKKIYGV